jgi:hypothetical protein
MLWNFFATLGTRYTLVNVGALSAHLSYREAIFLSVAVMLKTSVRILNISHKDLLKNVKG